VLNIGQSSIYDLIEREGLPYIIVKGAKQIPDQWLRYLACAAAMLHADGITSTFAHYRQHGEVSRSEAGNKEAHQSGKGPKKRILA